MNRRGAGSIARWERGLPARPRQRAHGLSTTVKQRCTLSGSWQAAGVLVGLASVCGSLRGVLPPL
jgi:hypothetical protein